MEHRSEDNEASFLCELGSSHNSGVSNEPTSQASFKQQSPLLSINASSIGSQDGPAPDIQEDPSNSDHLNSVEAILSGVKNAMPSLISFINERELQAVSAGPQFYRSTKIPSYSAQQQLEATEQLKDPRKERSCAFCQSYQHKQSNLKCQISRLQLEKQEWKRMYFQTSKQLQKVKVTNSNLSAKLYQLDFQLESLAKEKTGLEQTIARLQTKSSEKQPISSILFASHIKQQIQNDLKQYKSTEMKSDEYAIQINGPVFVNPISVRTIKRTRNNQDQNYDIIKIKQTPCFKQQIKRSRGDHPINVLGKSDGSSKLPYLYNRAHSISACNRSQISSQQMSLV